MSEKKFSAIVLSNGELISIAKKAEESKQYPDSNSLPGQDFGELYLTGRCAKPPYNPKYLAQLLESNTYHDRCVKQKAADIVGLGFDFEEDNPSEQDKTKKPDYKKLRDFFDNCHPTMTFNEIMTQAWIDYESIGYLTVEVLRTKDKKEIAAFEHIPASTCRVSLDEDLPGIIQKRGVKERYFKYFGDAEERIDPNTNLPATEVLYMASYHPRTDYYGIPDYVPAIGAIVANLEIRDFNIEFFDNNAIPDYAVILSGGEPDESFERTVKTYFQNNLKGKDKRHKTIVLSAPEGGKIEFQPLAVDIKDGHFRLYRLDCRDEIIHSHGVPPYRIGIAETGSLGGSTSVEANKIYKSSIVAPRQQKFEARINKLIKLGLNIEGWSFKYNELDLTDKKADADIKKTEAETYKIYIETGLKTVDEIRYSDMDLTRYKDMKEVDEATKVWANIPGPVQAIQQQQQAMQQQAQTQANLEEPVDANFEKDFEKQWQQEVKNQQLKKNFVSARNYIKSPSKSESILNKITNILKNKSKKDIFELQDELYNKMHTSLSEYFDDISQKTIDAIKDIDLEKMFPIKKGMSAEQADQINVLYPEAYSFLSQTMNDIEIGSLLYLLMEEGVTIGKQTAIDELGDVSYIDWDLYDKKTSLFLDNYVFKASQHTMDRLIGDVLAEIKKGQENGESIPQIQKRLNTVFVGMKTYETERIARTETAKSSNWARWQSYIDADKPYKKWKTNIDGRERDSHRAINGQIREMNKKFSNGLMYPGDPVGKGKDVINCRCTLFFLDELPEEK